MTATGSGDAALWKLSAEGTTLWAMRSEGMRSDGTYDTLQAVAVDGANAVVAAGSFSSSSATFGGVVLTNVNTGFSDAVLWKVSGLLLSCVNVACVSSKSIYWYDI